MASYAIAAAEVTGYKARVSVTVTSPTGGATMTVYRVVGAESHPVAGAIDVPAVSTVVDDAAAVLGRPATYRVDASDAGTATSSALTITVPVRDAVMSDPRSGAWTLVNVSEWGEADHANRADVIEIEGSSRVVVVHDVEVDPRRPLVVDTETLAEDRSIAALSASGRALLLRWATDTGEPDAWLHPIGGRRRLRWTGLDEAVRHSWPTVQHVTEDTTQAASADTLGDLENYVLPGTTMAAIAAAFATLGDIATTDLKAV